MDVSARAVWPGSAWRPVAQVSSAQNGVSPPPRGSHVRITAPGYTAPDLEGAVATATADSLSLLVRSSVTNVPMSAVTRMEYAYGADRARGALRGLVQAVPVAALYLSVGVLNETTDIYRNGVLEAHPVVMQEALVGAGVWLAIGAGLGAVLAPPAWQERGTSTSLLVQPGPRGTRVGMAVRF